MTSGVTLPVSCVVDGDCDDGVVCNGTETCDGGQCVPGASMCSMFEWDASDRLTGVRPLARGEHGLGYDDADRGISYTPPVIAGQPSGGVTVTRDPDGLVTRVDVDAGTTRSITTSRLPDGRPSWIQHDGHTINFGYDPTTAELQSLTTNDGIVTTINTDGPLLESVTWSGTAGVSGAVSFDYDDLWDVSAITAGGVSINYHYDADGAIECVAVDAPADATCASGLRIDANVPGRTLTEQMAGAAAVTSSYAWSDLGEATQTIHEWSTTGELSFSYEARDGQGRLTRVVEDDGGSELTLEYRYDVEGRLIEVKRDGVVSESYTYDPNGQRQSATRDGVSVGTITWDARDRLLQYGATTYEHDAMGRRTSRTQAGQTTTYTYDLLGQLRSVDLPGTTDDIEYLIDGAGRRVGREVGGVLQQVWLYLDGLRPIVELNGSGQVTRVFVYGAARAPSLIVVPAGQPDAGTYRVITDHLDSIRRVVNVESGDLIQARDYDAFGNVIVDTNPGWQPFGFAAGLYDPGARDPACVLAGGRYCGALVRFGARDYDPEIGRWTASDPILFDGGDTNLYNYVGGDPVQHLDPSGLLFDSCSRNPLCFAVTRAASNGVAKVAAAGAAAVVAARQAMQGLAPSAPRACALADRALRSTQQAFTSISVRAAGGAGRLTSIGNGQWRSSGGLVYGQGSIHGNRVRHVLAHTVPNTAKPTHSMSNVARNRVLGVVDEAWGARDSYTIHSSGNWNYRIDMGRVIGTAGQTAINTSVRPGTSEVITAFPVL